MSIYDSAAQLAGTAPTWLIGTEAARLNAYRLYKALYLNHDVGFQITLRGDEETPIFVPSGRRIANTMARYVAKDLGFAVTGGSETENTGAILAYGMLFNREEFFTNFIEAVPLGIAQGDWMLYIWADPLKLEGSRISIRMVDPATVFFLYHPDDKERVVGVQIVEVVNENGKELLRRKRWRKPTAPGHSKYNPDAPAYEGFIEHDEQVLELADFGTEKEKVVRTITTQLEVTGISVLPIYHFKNRQMPGETYGVSELQGLERLVYAINQDVTDEDVGLAMSSLGVWVTNQRPVDEEGNESDWVIGPRRVVELKGPKADAYFDRVAGITTVKPSQDHYQWLLNITEATAGLSDVALGQVDTAMAESGIALAIRFGPTLDEASKKNNRVVSKLNQFFFDLKAWFAAYESITIGELVTVTAVVGELLPKNKKELADLFQDLYANGVIDTLTYLTKLNELGYEIGDPAAIIAAADAERVKRAEEAQAAFDGGFGNRLGEEAGGEEGEPAEEPPTDE